MAVEVANRILLAWAILFIRLPMAISLIGGFLAMVGGILKALFKMTRKSVAGVLALCSTAMVWVSDILHGNGIARQWMVLVPTGMLFGIIGISYILWKTSMTEKRRVFAPEER